MFFFLNLKLKKKKRIGATLSGLQYLPWPGLEPGPPQWKAGILNTRPWWLKKCTTWALRVKFYLGQNEDCSPGGSISDSAERLLQILPSCTSFLVDGYGDQWSDPEWISFLHLDFMRNQSFGTRSGLFHPSTSSGSVDGFGLSVSWFWNLPYWLRFWVLFGGAADYLPPSSRKDTAGVCVCVCVCETSGAYSLMI